MSENDLNVIAEEPPTQSGFMVGIGSDTISYKELKQKLDDRKTRCNETDNNSFIVYLDINEVYYPTNY